VEIGGLFPHAGLALLAEKFVVQGLSNLSWGNNPSGGHLSV
jgi:hypothetical protein